MTRRIQRVNSLLKEVISEVIARDLNSHDIPELFTITEVDTSKDLKYAKVFISFIEDSPEKKEELLALLQSKAAQIGVIASKKVVLRYFPSLTFKLDSSIDNYLEIDTLLKKIEDEKGES